MNAQDIAKRMTELDAALADKLEEKPYLPISLSVRASLERTVSLFIYGRAYNDRLYRGYFTSFDKALDHAQKVIDELPSRDELMSREVQEDLAKVIEKANAIPLPREVTDPLRGASDALASNLLTYQADD